MDHCSAGLRGQQLNAAGAGSLILPILQNMDRIAICKAVREILAL
jgi:hypothetical protein